MSLQFDNKDLDQADASKTITDDTLTCSQELNQQNEVVSQNEEDVTCNDEDDEDDDDDDKSKLLSHQEAMEQFKDALAEIIVVWRKLF